MPRGLSKEYIELKDRLLAEQPDNLGLQLGDLCHKAGVLPATIARALSVAVTSVYRWMRGEEPREGYVKNIKRLMRILEYGVKHKILPPDKSLSLDQAIAKAAAELRAQQRS